MRTITKILLSLFIASAYEFSLAQETPKESPIVEAFMRQDYETFAALYEKIEDKNATQLSDGTSFPYLVFSLDSEDPRFFALVIQSADPNYSDLSFGRTALSSISTDSGNCKLDQVRLLVERGADVNHVATRSKMMTPLHGIAFSTCYEVAKYFIAKGADKDAMMADGRKPVGIAKEHSDAKMVSILQ